MLKAGCRRNFCLYSTIQSRRLRVATVVIIRSRSLETRWITSSIRQKRISRTSRRSLKPSASGPKRLCSVIARCWDKAAGTSPRSAVLFAPTPGHSGTNESKRNCDNFNTAPFEFVICGSDRTNQRICHRWSCRSSLRKVPIRHHAESLIAAVSSRRLRPQHQYPC